jgi:hypothetical protein
MDLAWLTAALIALASYRNVEKQLNPSSSRSISPSRRSIDSRIDLRSKIPAAFYTTFFVH